MEFINLYLRLELKCFFGKSFTVIASLLVEEEEESFKSERASGLVRYELPIFPLPLINAPICGVEKNVLSKERVELPYSFTLADC